MGYKIGYKRSSPISGVNCPDSFVSAKPLAFFKTKTGILKAVSVLLGFIVIVLTAVGYSQAGLFNDTENTTFCNWTAGHNGECWKGFYYRDQICEDRNKELSVLKRENLPQKTCPSRWLIIPSLYSLGFVWAATCIVLLVLLFSDMSAYRSFSLTDCIGHVIGGIMTLISALLVIVYFARVMTEDMCKPENIQREVQDTIERNYNRPHSYLNWIRYPNATVITLEREANCSQIQWETYFHWIFLVVGIFALVLGVLYIVIAVMVMMGTRSNPKIDRSAPMQSASNPYPGQNLEFPSPQQPGTPSMHSGSPSQAPDN